MRWATLASYTERAGNFGEYRLGLDTVSEGSPASPTALMAAWPNQNSKLLGSCEFAGMLVVRFQLKDYQYASGLSIPSLALPKLCGRCCNP